MKKNVCSFVFLPYKSKKIAEKFSSIYSMKNVFPWVLIRDLFGTYSGLAACIRSGRPPWVHLAGLPFLPWVLSVVVSVSVHFRGCRGACLGAIQGLKFFWKGF